MKAMPSRQLINPAGRCRRTFGLRRSLRWFPEGYISEDPGPLEAVSRLSRDLFAGQLPQVKDKE
jgi:hypothetical protein